MDGLHFGTVPAYQRDDDTETVAAFVMVLLCEGASSVGGGRSGVRPGAVGAVTPALVGVRVPVEQRLRCSRCTGSASPGADVPLAAVGGTRLRAEIAATLPIVVSVVRPMPRVVGLEAAGRLPAPRHHG